MYTYSTPNIYLAAYLMKNSKLHGIRTYSLDDIEFMIQGDNATIQQDIIDFQTKKANINYEKFKSYINRITFLLNEVKDKYLSEAS